MVDGAAPTATSEKPGLDPAFVERLRQSGLRIDREGRFIHEGEEVRHVGLRRALFHWLDRLPDGRYILRLDERRYAYVDVDDTPLVVRGAVLDQDGARLTLSDGNEEMLDLDTVSLDERGVLRCRVRGGRLEARLATAAVAALAEVLSESPSGAFLTLGGRSHRIWPRE